MVKTLNFGPCKIYSIRPDGTHKLEGTTTGPVIVTIGEKTEFEQVARASYGG